MREIFVGPREIPYPPLASPIPRPAEREGDFGTLLRQSLGEVNQLQQRAGEAMQHLAAGEVEDVHQVMVAAEEASVAFELMMEIRNKLVEAYQELMRMPV